MKIFHQVKDKLSSLHPNFVLAGAHLTSLSGTVQRLPPWGEIEIIASLSKGSLTAEPVHPPPTAILNVLW